MNHMLYDWKETNLGGSMENTYILGEADICLHSFMNNPEKCLFIYNKYKTLEVF